MKSCLPTVVTPAGGMRLLRVIVDARLPDWDVMAAIGHELQHALEILRDPHARTTEAAYFLFSRERGWTGNSFETAAARTAGDAVRRDVAAFARDGSTRRGPPRP